MTALETLMTALAELDWPQFKTALVALSGFSRDALHIYASMFVFVTACLAFRWKPSEWKPWLLVLAVQSVNEASDLWEGLIWPEKIGLVAQSSIADTLATMIFPTLMLCLARYSSVFGARTDLNSPADLGDEF
jgi:hypothetical protein